MEYTSTVFLVSLDDAKSYLNLSSSATSADEGKLGWIIEAISREMDEYCNRGFLEEQRTEYYDGNGTDQLWLRAAPISAVASVNVDAYHDFDSDTLEESGNYFVDADSGRLIHDSVWPRGASNIKVIYTGGYTQAIVPKDIQLAVLGEVSRHYRQSEGSNVEVTDKSDPNGASVSFSAEEWLPTTIRTMRRYVRRA